jgi:hypothetical protein
MPVIPAMAGSVKKEDWGPGQPGQKMRPYVKNNQSKKKTGGMAQVVALAEQAWSPEFKLQ